MLPLSESPFAPEGVSVSLLPSLLLLLLGRFLVLMEPLDFPMLLLERIGVGVRTLPLAMDVPVL